MSDTQDFTFGSGFQFSGATIDGLTAAQYTLVTIALDESGSIDGKEDEIREMLLAAVGACYSSPYANNLLLRVLRFSSQYNRQGNRGIDEIHGFKTLAEIDTKTYPTLRGGGGTPLCDAVYSGVGAMNAYAQSLVDMDFAVNGITFVVTDGGENGSFQTMNKVKDELAASVQGEVMESHVSILIGIDTTAGKDDTDPWVIQVRERIKQDLEKFQKEAGMDQFIWAGAATKSSLAKLAAFVSQSISSTSMALGTGGPSQNISATI